MSGCFLFKDPVGRTGGYLMQSIRELRVFTGSVPEQAQAMVFFDDGSRRILSLTDGQEILSQSDGRNAAGAVVFSGEEVLLSTGEKARRAFYAAVRKERNASADAEISDAVICEEKEKRRQENNCAQETGGESRLSDTEMLGSCTRRWPPPPCLNGAQYVKGKWREEE